MANIELYQQTIFVSSEWMYTLKILNKNKTLCPLFMDGVQLPQGLCHFEEAVYFLPQSSQIFLVLILSILKGWKAASNLDPLNGFEHGTPGLKIQHLNH